MVYGIDICNTIADVNRIIEKVLGPNPVPSCYRHPKATKEFWLNNLWVFEEAQPIANAAEILQNINKRNKIIYITARPKAVEDVTKQWLREHGFPECEIIFTENKVAVAKSLGIQRAIEDAPHEIEAYLKAGIDVMVKKQPYNTAYLNRFDWAVT